MRREYGQSLGEYFLLASLIAVVSIGALSFFANDFSATLPGLLDRIFGGGGQGASATSTSSSGNSSSSGNVASGFPSGVSTTGITLTTAGGTVINLANYPSNLANAVETAGGNGTTNVLLANLEQIINGLEAAGELDEAQINLLKNLANQGHRLAEIQKAAEAFDQAFFDSGSSSSDSYREFDFQYNGGLNTPYSNPNASTLDNLVRDLNVSDKSSQNLENLDPVVLNAQTGFWEYNPDNNNLTSSEIGSFVHLYQEAVNQGVLDDPSLKQLVTGIGSDILEISESYTDSLYKRNDRNNAEYSSNPPTESFIIDASSELSNSSASAICAAGGGISCN